MKRVVAYALWLTGIYGCQRICGDLVASPAPGPRGESGAGGDVGATAGDGGAPPITPTGGSGGTPVEGGAGGDRTGESGAPTSPSCSAPPGPEITDFEVATQALGDMKSDEGSPDGLVEPDAAGGRSYHEIGSLPEVGSPRFTFTFKSCIDVSDYAGIRFNATGTPPFGVDVLTTAGNRFHFDAMTPVVCVPFATDQTTVLALEFTYSAGGTGGTAPAEVDLWLDNFTFYKDPCPR